MKPIFEIFEEVEGTRAKKKRIEILQENKSEQLVQILNYAYNPNLKFNVDIPEFVVTGDLEGATKFRLYSFIKQFPYLTNEMPNVDKSNRTKVLLNILTQTHQKDVEIIRGIVEFRKIPYDRIDKDIALEAFPELADLWQ